MPELPQIFARPSVPDLQLPRVGAESYGAEAFRMLEKVSGHLADGLSAAETAKLKGEGAANIQDALAQNKIKYDDPEEYKSNAADAVKKAYSDTLARASIFNKPKVEAALADDLIRANTHVAITFHEKQLDKGMADYESFMRDSEQKYRQTPEGPEREMLMAQVKDTTLKMVKSGFLKAKDAEKKVLDFNANADYWDGTRAILTDADQFLSDLKDGKYSHLKPEQSNYLLRNATDTARRNDEKLIQKHTADQRANWRAMSRLADEGKLTPEAIKEADGVDDITPNQAKDLLGRAGTPIFQTSPGSVNSIMTKMAVDNLTPNAVAEAKKKLRDLYQVYPKDPHIGSALEEIDRRERIRSANPKLAKEAATALREFDLTPHNGRTLRERFIGPLAPMGQFRERYEIEKEKIRHDIQDLSVPRAKAVQDARERLLKQSGSGRSQQQQNEINDIIGR